MLAREHIDVAIGVPSYIYPIRIKTEFDKITLNEDSGVSTGDKLLLIGDDTKHASTTVDKKTSFELRRVAFDIFSKSRYFTDKEREQYNIEIKKQYSPTGRTMYDLL